MDDDLLLTNQYLKTQNSDSSDTKLFNKLMNAKEGAKKNYSENNPAFAETIKTDRNTGMSIDENSVAFEQYIKFAQTDKKKKLKKTILNIDSRNRTSNYTYDSSTVEHDGNNIIEFHNNSSTFTINTGTHINYISDISTHRQAILGNLTDTDFNRVGVGKVNFEFNVQKGSPIFNIATFSYVDSVGKILTDNDTFDTSRQQYKFNRLTLPLPHNIDSSEIQTVIIGSSITVNIITNIAISYPSPSHYFINLDRAFSNIYSVRLVSSEIPNTSYTFNENLIETNFGQFKLSTKQNNKLRWINKTDRVHVLNNNIMKAAIFHQNMPLLPNIPPESYHKANYLNLIRLCNINLSSINVKVASSDHVSLNSGTIDSYPLQENDFFIIKNQTDTKENGLYQYISSTWSKIIPVYTWNVPYIYFIDSSLPGTPPPINNYKYYVMGKINTLYNFKEIDYINNLRRMYSLIYLSQFKDRDYYVDSKYIGNFHIDTGNILGIVDNPDSNLFISDTIYTFNKNLLYNLTNDLKSFYIFKGYTSANVPVNRSYTKFEFTKGTASEKELNILLYPNGSSKFYDFINVILLNTVKLPTKVIFNSLGSEHSRYSFYIYSITDTTLVQPATPSALKRYKLSLIPIEGDFDNNIPFESYIDVAGNGINMVLFNELTSLSIFNYMKYKPDTWSLMKNYYLTSEICLFPSTTQVTSPYKRTYFITAAVTGDIQIEYKTYHTFTFINTPTFKQVKKNTNNTSIDIYFTDSNSNSVSDISNIAREYTSLKINNNLYRINTHASITYDTENKFYSIPMVGSIADIGDDFKTDSTIKLYFQKYEVREIQNLYLDNVHDYSNNVIRMFGSSVANYDSYIEFYIAGKELNKYEVRYKNSFGNLDISSTGIQFQLFTEHSSVFFRDFIGSYIVTDYDNINYDNNGININQIDLGFIYNTSESKVAYNPSYNLLKMYNDNISNKNFKSDIVDITSHDIVSVSSKLISDGINELSFAKEYVTTTDINSVYINPKVNSSSNSLPGIFELKDDSPDYTVNTVLKEAVKYPVYELNIASGKYSADSIVKYMLSALDNLKSRIYDYSKGIFYTDSSFNKFIDLNNEFGINQESKFVISVNKSVNSIVFKQYKKIFDAHKNTSVVKGKIAYYNEGFPYIYFNIPQISLINNSLVYLSGGGSLSNISGAITRGEKNAIIPPNYKIRIRQLLPLPRSDSVKNTQNLFAKEGFVDVTDNEIYNKYVDFINNSVNESNTKDISATYIVKRIFGIGESSYADFKNLSEDKIKYLDESYSDSNIAVNSSNITENDLNKSYLNNYGVNTPYESVGSFNNESSQLYTANKTAIEYYGQAMINGYRNEETYKEYSSPGEEDTSDEYGDPEISGFKTTFIQNEIFMRLSDVNITHKDNITGRFTNVTDSADRYGNIEADYDLFSDNYVNFKIGDIVIGLDSNTIGIILPYDYTYNTLPNLDLITLGLGAYLMNKTVFDSGAFFEKYTAITDTSTNWREKSKSFINNINTWQIEKNKTSRGFYIFTSVTPNESKLTGAKLSNFQIYLPRFFKFIEDSDTALSKFGLKNSENNNKWNYFKTNYESNYEVTIKRSFFNTAKNNDIYSDYIIFETKSTDNLNVNDRVYIEDHQVIMRDGDFRREKFFNVSLIEPFSSFVSKLQTIYNNTIVNYNGLSGIGEIYNDGSDNDNKYLNDHEYKYENTQGNSSAKAIAIITATISAINVISAGRGFTGAPVIQIDSTHLSFNNPAATVTATRDNYGTISNISSGAAKSEYNNIPSVAIENPSITPVIQIKSVNASGGITELTGLGGGIGFGYTESPIITAPTSGVTATAAVQITGIGTVTIKNYSVSPSGIFINSPLIIFNAPVSGDGAAAEGYVDGQNVIMYKTGKGYVPGENIKFTMIQSAALGLTAEQTAAGGYSAQVYLNISIDAIGSITVGNNGSNYNSTYPPNVVITDLGGGIESVVIASVSSTSNNISEYTVINGGKGYTNSTIITIDPPRAIISSKINIDGRINTLDILAAGVGYTVGTKLTELTVSPPKITAVGIITSATTISITTGGTGYVQDEGEVISGDNTNANITNEITNGKLINIILINRGTIIGGVVPGITISAPGTGITATATAVVKNNILIGAIITEPGSGYTSAPILSFTNNDTAAGVCNISRGRVLSSIITAPTVSLTGTVSGLTITYKPPFTEATAVATITGVVTEIKLYQGGVGYTSVPNITIGSGGGSGAGATCTITDGSVNSSTNVTSGGSGYTSIPLITIDDPSTIQTLTIPFKNKYIYRYLNQELDDYTNNYYLEYTNGSSIPSGKQFKITYNTGNSGDIKDIITNTNISILPKYVAANEFNSNNMIILVINEKVYKLTNGIFIPTDAAGVFVGTASKSYYINIKIYRLPVAVDAIGQFDPTHLSSTSKYISNYSTLGIFERLLDEQINDVYKNMSYNIIKSSELYRRFSYNVFKNRVIKLKVCPIDDKGFCYEPLNLDGSIATETNISNRSVKGYSKKLFPYHEYDIIKSYDKSEFGTNIDVVGVPYKSFRRPHQLLKNTEQTSKAFLPGMGVYIIEDEKAVSGSRINNTHYNITSTSKDIPLYYSEYTYSNKFIGYVLNTSVNNKQEYDRNYRLNSKNFSKVDNSKSTASEYYIYMLIDPNITTSGEIDQLFNLLNKDNINIVFDAGADTDFSETPLTDNGYVTSKNAYYVNSTTNTHKTKSDDKPYSIAKNTYGHRTFLNEQDKLLFFEDENYDTSIEDTSIDAFINLTASAVTIRKPKLNRTLPYYNFQKRLACATITERPVAYEARNDISSRKMFLAGDYDYFYRTYMEHKAVMRYDPILDNKNIDNMNKHNIIIENAVSANFKEKNFKETNCHANYLDADKNIHESSYNMSNKTPEFEQIEGSKPILKFNSGEDIILVDALKLKFSYEEADNNYSSLRGRGDNKLGTPNTHVKILVGSILPKLYFNHNRLYDNSFNKFIQNTTVLDYDYDSNLERLTYNTILGKYKPDRINIVGNNSDEYARADETDQTKTYTRIFITNINDARNEITINKVSNLLNDGIIPQLQDCLVLINTNIKCINSTQPIDNTNNCEIRNITKSEAADGNTKIKLSLNNSLYFKTHQTNSVDISATAFLLYLTVKTSTPLTYGNSANPFYMFDIINSVNVNIHYKKIQVGDYILLDWGMKRDLKIINGPPHIIKTTNDTEYTSMYTTATYRVEALTENTLTNTVTISILNPKILYPAGTKIFILKNPVDTINNIPSVVPSLSHTFLSTQPFTINNKWFTRIYYKGNSYNIGSHYNPNYKKTKVFTDIDDNYIHGGDPLFNTNYSNTIYIGGMKGIKIPYIDIDSADEPIIYSAPVEDNFYEAVPVLKEDFTINKNTSPITVPINGYFESNIHNIKSDNSIATSNINTPSKSKWITSDKNKQYSSIVIEGLFMGYGGFIEERANQDTINAVINKDRGLAIKKITQINNKFYIYLQLSSTYNNIFPDSNLAESKNLINQSSRQNYMDYETNLKLLDDIFKNDNNRQDYEEYISVYGIGGKITRKIIKNPYDLNPDNYIYMVIPDLNHIDSIQNKNIDGAFAKILLPGESTKTLFSSFVAGSKVFYNNLFNNLTELEITFITNDGYLFDFNGSEHSFSIEITEIIDKFEYINPRFGNIEI